LLSPSERRHGMSIGRKSLRRTAGTVLCIAAIVLSGRFVPEGTIAPWLAKSVVAVTVLAALAVVVFEFARGYERA
jgi:hypothetical protein